MKYPQLVSNRAVREISDWLIKRLEDLDIEQPSVYSRLLLSLLHTPFKVNAIDLLEIPQLKDLKQPYHLLNKNNEELKRLAAVECLMEVSAEENKSSIVSLVDELHLKLRKIESSCEEGGSAASIGRTIAPTSPTSSKFYKNLKKIKRNHGAENPTKNYYLAFPALSSQKTTATTTITSGGVKRSPGGVETKKDSKDLQLLCWSSLMTKESSPAKEAVVATVKRPGKKRRYGRHRSVKNDVQCNAKTFEGATYSPKAQNGSKKHQRNQLVATTKNPKNYVVDRGNQLSMGSAPWDMDFKGHWEMERDLISEFKNPKSTKQVDLRPDDDDDMMLKFLPNRLMEDDPIGDKIYVKAKEAQSISSLKSKFDENVKALWDVDDPVRDAGSNTSLVSEKNSLSLFNFSGHQPQHHLEVVAPAQEFDRGMNHFYQTGSAVISPAGAEKFIKSGTNLTMSIWSDGEPENSIFRDVVDHGSNDDAIYKRMKSIGAEMKSWQKGEEEPPSEVSLFNHSEASAFKRFRPLIAATVIRANYHPINTPQFDRSMMLDDDENLLTSERSHFEPIIDDGHTFIVDSQWEEIKWERSPSGGLVHESKHYMKFREVGDLDLASMEDDETEFSIKFVVQVENDKACQTDLNDFLRASHRSLMEINEAYCRRKIYDEYSRGVVDNKWRYHLEDSNDYSLFSQVKSSAPPKSLQDMLMSSNSSSSSICTITSSAYETPAVDPFESWRSMKVDRGNLDSNHKPACMHSMWEQCITCDPFEEKSIPADDQLKIEALRDGDEIMNVIQNLYIGDFCEDEEKEDEDCGDMNHFYDMLDDSMDDSKFYEEKEKAPEKVKLTPNMFEQLQLEKFDEITLAKLQMQWEWEKNNGNEADQVKCMKMLRWLQHSIQKHVLLHDANNNCEWFDDDSCCNRKRRHSTCQNLMEMKSQCRQSPALIEDNCAKKMMKIMLVGEIESKEEGKNYYRNILQNQHAMIKHLDLARPLTR